MIKNYSSLFSYYNRSERVNITIKQNPKSKRLTQQFRKIRSEIARIKRDQPSEDPSQLSEQFISKQILYLNQRLQLNPKSRHTLLACLSLLEFDLWDNDFDTITKTIFEHLKSYFSGQGDYKSILFKGLVDALLRKRRYSRALEVLDYMGEQEESISKNSVNRASFGYGLLKGDILCQINRYSEAIRAYNSYWQSVIEVFMGQETIQPEFSIETSLYFNLNQLEVLAKLARAQIKIGNLQKSQEYCERLNLAKIYLWRYGNYIWDPEVYISAGYTLIIAGDYENAIDWYTQAAHLKNRDQTHLLQMRVSLGILSCEYYKGYLKKESLLILLPKIREFLYLYLQWTRSLGQSGLLPFETLEQLIKYVQIIECFIIENPSANPTQCPQLTEFVEYVIRNCLDPYDELRLY